MEIYRISGMVDPRDIAEDDYRGQHMAPCKGSGAPLHDVTGVYPDDIYSDKALAYYGAGESYDALSLSIIKYYHNKPNFSVTIYRAIPDFNYEINNKIKELHNIIYYFSKFKFFPMNNRLVNNLRDKYPISNHTYDEQQQLMLDDFEKQVTNLALQKKKK